MALFRQVRPRDKVKTDGPATIVVIGRASLDIQHPPGTKAGHKITVAGPATVEIVGGRAAIEIHHAPGVRVEHQRPNVRVEKRKRGK